jgi:hypothetical protein
METTQLPIRITSCSISNEKADSTKNQHLPRAKIHNITNIAYAVSSPSFCTASEQSLFANALCALYTNEHSTQSRAAVAAAGCHICIMHV